MRDGHDSCAAAANEVTPFDEMMNRIFIALLVVFAGVWIWSSVMFRRQVAEDDVFYAARVAPYLEETRRQSADLERVLQERKQGKQAPFSVRKAEGKAPLEEAVERMNTRFGYQLIGIRAQMGLGATFIAWMITSQIQAAVRRRRFSSPDRPAAANAGYLVGDLVRLKRSFTAKAPGGPMAPEIQVDGERAVVVFRHYAFVTSFVRNPAQDRVEIPFGDLLVGVTLHGKGRIFLQLRTTRGEILINDVVHPFLTLIQLLLDIVELNRTSPETYRAALAREPQLRTPWYGWALIAVAAFAVIGWFWLIL